MTAAAPAFVEQEIDLIATPTAATAGPGDVANSPARTFPTDAVSIARRVIADRFLTIRKFSFRSCLVHHSLPS